MSFEERIKSAPSAIGYVTEEMISVCERDKKESETYRADCESHR